MPHAEREPSQGQAFQLEGPLESCPVVILCGGQGSRVADVSREVPKPLLPIGGMPVVWHIMKIYSQQGFHHFILCLGHLGDRIESFFKEPSFVEGANADLNYSQSSLAERMEPCWQVEFAYTGENTTTGGRIKQVEHLLPGETFMLTYGDGLARIDLHALLATHAARAKVATVTGARVNIPYGVFDVEDGVATAFSEKPLLESRINGGYFAFRRDVLDYIGPDDALEEEPLRRLVAERQLAVYEHDDYWRSMDTRKDFEGLNAAWSQGDTPWKTW